jgi:membrane associated rhomboid family serine protease
MTATYTIQTAVIVPGYVTVTTLTPNEIVVGASITVAGAGTAYNGVKSVYAMPQYLPINVDTEGLIEYDTSYPLENAVMWADTQTPVEIHAQTGTITFEQLCTWVTGPQIATYLGITTSGDETAFLVQCAAAANAFCFRRRQESSYIDSLTTSPGGDVTLGVLMYGSALYRQRGSVDQFASFTDMASAPVVGLSGIVKQLLGINRPQVA